MERLARVALERPVALLTSLSDLQRSHVPILRQAVAERAVQLLAERALEGSCRLQAILVRSCRGPFILVGRSLSPRRWNGWQKGLGRRGGSGSWKDAVVRFRNERRLCTPMALDEGEGLTAEGRVSPVAS